MEAEENGTLATAKLRDLHADAQGFSAGVVGNARTPETWITITWGRSPTAIAF